MFKFWMLGEEYSKFDSLLEIDDTTDKNFLN